MRRGVVYKRLAGGLLCLQRLKKNIQDLLVAEPGDDVQAASLFQQRARALRRGLRGFPQIIQFMAFQHVIGYAPVGPLPRKTSTLQNVNQRQRVYAG